MKQTPNSERILISLQKNSSYVIIRSLRCKVLQFSLALNLHSAKKQRNGGDNCRDRKDGDYRHRLLDHSKIGKNYNDLETEFYVFDEFRKTSFFPRIKLIFLVLCFILVCPHYAPIFVRFLTCFVVNVKSPRNS